MAEQRYYPYGEERWASGTLPTDRRFTGQRWVQGLGLYDYNARWYHPALGRFVSADTIVPEPGNSQSLNRYAYVYNNPLRYTDPTGYFTENEIQEFLGVETWGDVLAFFEEGGSLEGRWGWLEILRQGKDGDFVYVSESSSPFEWFGKFAAFDCGLYINTYGPDGYLAMEEVASQYDYYRIRRFEASVVKTYATEFTFAAQAHQRYYHWRIEESKIDWAGFSLDAGGIIADVFTLGIAGRLGNAAKVAKTGGSFVGMAIGEVDLAYGGAQFWSRTTRQQVSWVDTAGLVTDMSGIFVPIGPDLVGLGLNFGNAVQRSP